MLLHISAVTFGDWQSAKDVTTETTTCKKYVLWLYLRNLCIMDYKTL